MNSENKEIKKITFIEGDVSCISYFFIKKADEYETLITSLKLQQLLYYSYVWGLVLKNQKLFNNNIEAGKHGPIIQSEYIKFKNYGKNAINDLCFVIDEETFPKPLGNFLSAIGKSYGKYSGGALREQTHREDPGADAVNESYLSIISDESIKEFYTLEKSNEFLPKNLAIEESDENGDHEFLVLDELIQ